MASVNVARVAEVGKETEGVMSTPCECATIGADPAIVTRCPHYHFFRGDKRLTGVGSVIKSVWPDKPSWDGVDMAVVENARERGSQVDSLFCSWLDGTLAEIPTGTREDAIVGFNAVRKWWELEDRGETQTQTVFADDEIVGVTDIVTSGGWLYDLKCTAKIEDTYELVLGAYLELSASHKWGHFNRCGLIHCKFTKDKDGAPVATVKPVIFEPMKALSEFRVLRQFWTMYTRRQRRN